MTTRRNVLQQLIAQEQPEATLLHWWPMIGGSSAETFALEFQSPNQTPTRWIVRQLKAQTTTRNPNAAAEQFAVQQQLHAAGLTIPRPIAYEQSCTLLSTPYVIFEFIDGRPIYQMNITHDQIGQIAVQLAQLHQIRPPASLCAILHTQSPSLPPPHQVLQTLLPHFTWKNSLPSTMGQRALLHGDFWPGNLLWRDGRLVAVIDWEDAKIGDPLEDLAISRLDVCFIFGRNALHHFTETYLAHNPINTDSLPLWDLQAANRMLHGLPDWADGWSDLGRPDLTADFMRQEALWLAKQAISQKTVSTINETLRTAF